MDLQFVFYVLIFFAAKKFFGECLQNTYCSIPCDYGKGLETHTVCSRGTVNCGPGPKCGQEFKVIPLNETLRQMLLDLHNELRNKVASGRESRNRQPTAANMKLLNYDSELEYIAQCWTNACNGNPLDHDKCRRTSKHPHVGQNLAIYSSTSNDVDIVQITKQHVMAWYEEVKDFKSKWVRNTQNRGLRTGHYTQMLWADTDSLGCAITYYTTIRESHQKFHNYILACNYGPGGNYKGAPVYFLGKPCSKCAENESCNDKYRALCGKTKNLS